MIKREIIDYINNWIGEKKIIILKGPRQVGKTTIMKNIQEKLIKDGFDTIFFSADLELGNDLFISSKNFINFIKTQIGDKKLYIFIDEFQYISNAGLFLKGVFDELKDDIQIIVSGSSSLEINKNSEYLTGRKIDFEIKGINFFEYINYFSKFKYKKYNLDEIFTVKFDDSDIKTNLINYLKYSSYPEVIITDNIEKKQTILKEIISTYIGKDISGFMKIDEIRGFNNLLKLLSNQIGNLVNKSEIANTLNIDQRKINHYLEILEGTYVITLVKPFYTNIRKEISKMPKIYFENLGVINYYNDQNISNIETLNGSFVENFTYNALSEIFDKNDIYYYRTISKSEIDFIIKSGDTLLPIEVKYRNKVLNMPIAINNFETNYKNISRKILITKNELSRNGNNYFIPFYLLPFITKSSF